MVEFNPPVIIKRRTHYLVYGAGRGVDGPARKELSRSLSIWETDASKASWLSFRAELEDVDPANRRVLRLPGEIDPHLLQRVWPTHRWEAGARPWAARRVAIRFRTGEYPYRDRDQGRIVAYLTGEERPEGEQEPGSYLVVAKTAAGKSYCAIRAWTHYGDVLLGVFAQLPHLENFRIDLLKFTDLTEDEVLIIDEGRVSLRRALKEPGRYKVALVLHRTATSCLSDVIADGVLSGPSEFTEFVQALGVGTAVFDECHLELRSLLLLGMTLNVARTFYLTATPKRTEWREDRVLRQQLPFSRALIVQAPARLVARQVKFDSGPTLLDVAHCINRRDYFDPVRYFDYIIREDKYLAWEEMVTALVGDCFNEPEAESVALVLGGRLEFLAQVIVSVHAAFPGRTVGNFSSMVPIASRMAELDRDIIVTTQKSFGGSVNPDRVSHMLLLAPIASPVWLEQITGRLRGVRGRPSVVLDIWDNGFDKLRLQAASRRTAYKRIATALTQEEYLPRVNPSPKR